MEISLENLYVDTGAERLKEGEVRRKVFQTKLLSRLSHRVFHLLSSPVHVRTFTIHSAVRFLFT